MRFLDVDWISGPAGTYWANDTSDLYEQLVCKLERTCGYCFPYHTKIARRWPRPFHDHCHCEGFLIVPGQRAPLAFADYRVLVDGMSAQDRAAAVGLANYALLSRGIVEWHQLVHGDGTRVLTLEEVVSRNRLSRAALLAAGIKPFLADRVLEEARRTHEELARRARSALNARLRASARALEGVPDPLRTGSTFKPKPR
jgi:hypothetical protein